MFRNRDRSSRGQTMVEFALILPILMFLLTGFFDLGRVVLAHDALGHAAREAARYAIVHGGSSANPCPVGPPHADAEVPVASASCPYPSPSKESIRIEAREQAAAAGSHRDRRGLLRRRLHRRHGHAPPGPGDQRARHPGRPSPSDQPSTWPPASLLGCLDVRCREHRDHAGEPLMLRTRSTDEPRGQVLVIVAVVFIAMLAFLAVLFDGANGMLTRREMQDAGDAAVLAGANVIQVGTPRGCSATPGGAPRASVALAVRTSLTANLTWYDAATAAITCPAGFENQAVAVDLTDGRTAVLRRRHRQPDPRLNPLGRGQPRHHRHRVLDRAARPRQPQLAERPARMSIRAPVGWPDGRPPGDDARQLELHCGERWSPQHERQRRQPHHAERLSDPPRRRVRGRLHDAFRRRRPPAPRRSPTRWPSCRRSTPRA